MDRESNICMDVLRCIMMGSRGCSAMTGMDGAGRGGPFHIAL